MTALSQDRNTPRREGAVRSGLAAASALIYAGAIVMREADGYLSKGATATGSIAVGRAEARIDNSGGADGDLLVPYRTGVFRFANSASADAITMAEIGDLCWIVDDQTVAKTSGSDTRSPAGLVEDVDAHGVWVRFDEQLTATRAIADEALATASA